ncbi:Lrp/AsnC family transcriptional regulator [Halorussus salilacus]|uniref:Lrp/AsnC family transcriptional regulator n=1 Tax=Halorussus salilacus TaxID=2953750 RepID=UPI0020A1D3C9|nr:Lrp/AsnC family transcriptional regulator [Halorussus salilacus]USZ69464.1 Lrp/AsnC family transcriptional regulator [Halorussus salilacus]
MHTEDLDDLDEFILHELQRDARHVSASTIAESVDVAPSTVRNRIRKLEDCDVIKGYPLDVDYELAGYPLHTLIVCTAPMPEREELAKEALDVPGVVAVREIMTGEENIHATVVGTDHDDLSRIGQDLNELGLEVVEEDLIRSEHYQSFQRFDSREE